MNLCQSWNIQIFGKYSDSKIMFTGATACKKHLSHKNNSVLPRQIRVGDKTL